MSAQPDFRLRGAISDHISGIVGPAHVRPALPEDAVLGVPANLVVEPGTTEELSAVLRIANDAGLSVTPRGGGTKLAWGGLPRAVDVIVSMTRLNRIIEHAWADLTVTVEAGCTVEELQRKLAEHGQRLATDAFWPERATIGGILATNDSGSLRARFGGLRDLIIGITLVLSDGTIAKSGGKVVKNVAGYDLMKLATGSLGTLGVIACAVFRLHPQPHRQRTISFVAEDPKQATDFLLRISNCSLAYTGLQVRCGTDVAPVIDLRFEGTQAGIDAQIQSASRIGSDLKSPTIDAADAWLARHDLCRASSDDVVFKVSFLPADFAQLHRAIQELTSAPGASWSMLAYGHGLGWVRLKTASSEASLKVVSELRPAVAAGGGSIVVLEAPLAMRERLDVWGDAGDVVPLMRRIKQQFDPRGTLNPGRFAGGI